MRLLSLLISLKDIENMRIEFIKKSEFSLDGYSVIKASVGDIFDLPEDLSTKFISRGLCKSFSKEPETTESSTEPETTESSTEPETTESSTEPETTESSTEPENKNQDDEDEDDFFGDSNKPATRKRGRRNKRQ
jgi:hypothetical protein